MKRLTEFKDGKFQLIDDLFLKEAIERLGKLEIIAKLKENGFIYKTDNGNIVYKAIDENDTIYLNTINEDVITIKHFYDNGFYDITALYFCDYQKTWIVNKEKKS